MNKEELEAFAREAAKGIKSEQDFADFRQILMKVTVETALNAEPDEHLGYARLESSGSSNGLSRKTVRTEEGQFDLETPVTERAALSRRSSRNTKPTSLPWTIKFAKTSG